MVKNINKKLLLDKFILISVILVFVNMYSKIFGSENILIGVTVITAVLMFKEMDLGYNLKQSILLVVGLFTYIGFIASLNSINMFLGFVINLVSIFFTIYFSTENIYTRAYLPFILMYVFMEGNSISSSTLLNRVIASFVGGSIIGLTLYVTRKKKAVSDKNVLDIFKENIDVSNERIRFSVKMALGVSLAILIGRIIGAEKGMWISIAVMSLTQPQFEETKERMKKRILSTIIGFAIFIVLFKIIIPSQYIALASMALGYIYTFVEEYGIKMIFVTINALVASMHLFTTPVAMQLRLGFLLIGAVLIYIISKIEIRILNNSLGEEPCVS